MKHLQIPRLSRIIRFFLSCCLLCLAGVTPSIEAKIVFCVDGDICVMNDDGSHKRRLTHSTQATHRYPRWSPDGTQIAFTRYMDRTQRQTTAEVFVMNADGTDPQRLTYNNVLDVDSAWSPDGQHLAFSSTRTGAWEVFIIEIATRALTQLTSIEDGVGSAAPDWSPDGT